MPSVEQRKRYQRDVSNDELIEVVNDLFSYTKTINVIGLAQGLEDGNVLKGNVTRELAGLTPEMTSEKINKLGVSDLPVILDDLYNTAKNECAKSEKPCEGLDVIVNGANELAKYGTKIDFNVSDVFKDGSVLDGFSKIKQTFEKLNDIHTTIRKTKDHLNSDAKTDAEKDTKVIGLRAGMDELETFDKNFESGLPSKNIESLTQEKLEAQITNIENLESLSTSLKKGSLGLLKTKTSGILSLAETMMPKLPKKIREELSERMKMLKQINDMGKSSVNEMHVTGAFYKRPVDFDKIFLEIEALFKKWQLDTTKKANLRKLLASLSNLNKEVQPIFKVLQTRENILGAVYEIRKDLEDAHAELETVEVIKPLNECATAVSVFDVKLEMDKWATEKTNAVNIGTHAKEFVEKCQSTSIVFTELLAFKKEISDPSSIVTYDKMIISPRKAATLQELENAEKKVAELQKHAISTWVKSTELHELIPSYKQWLNGPEIATTLECVKNETIFKAVNEKYAKRAILTAIKKLGAENQYREDIRKAVENVKTKVTALATIESSPKKRSIPEGDSIPKFENALVISKDLSVGLKAYRDLITAYASKKDIKKLLSLENTIDGLIEKLTDLERKKKMKNLWNEKVKTTLKSIPSVVANLSKKIKSSPKKIGEYSEILRIDDSFGELSNVNMQDLIDNLQAIDSNLLDQETSERLRSLEMDFASGDTNRAVGLKAFLMSIPIFSAIFPSTHNLADDDPKNNKSDIWTTFLHIGIGIVSGMILLFFYMFIKSLIELRGESNLLFNALKKAWLTFTQYKKKPKVENNFDTTGQPRANVTEPTVIKKNDGTFFVRPASNAAVKGKETIAVNKKNKEEIVWTDYKESCDSAMLATIESLIEVSKKFGEQQKILRTGYRKETEEKKIVVFKNRTAQEWELIRNQIYADVLFPNPPDPDFRVPLVTYFVGLEWDKFEASFDDLPSEEVRRALDAAVNNEQPGNRMKEDDEKLLNELQLRTARDVQEYSRKVIRNPSLVEIKPQTSEKNRASAGSEEKINLDELEIKEGIETNWIKPYKNYINAHHHKHSHIDSPDLSGIYDDDYFQGKKVFMNNEPLDYGRFQRLMHSEEVITNLKNSKNNTSRAMIGFEKACEILRMAGNEFDNENAIIKLNRKKMRVVGDIHGSYNDMARQLEVGMDDLESTYLFLGDYVDRGDRCIDTLMNLCILKISCPTRYYFLRGNHELRSVNWKSFMSECIEKYGRTNGEKFWKLANDMFEKMPLASILQNKIFCSHGGVSPLMLNGRKWLEENLKKHPETIQQWKLFSDILWSDPDERFPSTCGVNDLFPIGIRSDFVCNYTPLGLKKVLDECGFAFIVRGHQIVEAGFEQFYSFKCITTYGAVNQEDNNKACQMIIHENLKVDFIIFKPQDTLTPAEDEETVDGGDDDDKAATKQSQKPKNKKSKSKSKSPQGARPSSADPHKNMMQV